MQATERAARRLVPGRSILRDPVCLFCRVSQRRSASTASALAIDAQEQQLGEPPILATAAAEPQKAYRLLASPLLSRPPLLTRDLTSFEKSFYLYQKRLNERLALPFSRYFYYKKGTPSDIEWKRKVAARKTAARDIGAYSGYGEEAWNDEVLIGSELSEPANMLENLARDVEGKLITGAPLNAGKVVEGDALPNDTVTGDGRKSDSDISVERPMPRKTRADETNDVTSPNRKLDRTLYLLVRRPDGSWRFPEDRVYGRENLKEAASRVVASALGPNLLTWLVGNHPVAYYGSKFQSSTQVMVPEHPGIRHSLPRVIEEHGEKVFFMKGRVMAGQVGLPDGELSNREWAWLTKEEVSQRVSEGYWKAVKNALAER